MIYLIQVLLGFAWIDGQYNNMRDSRIQAEIREYTSNEANNIKLMNFYRCAKTLTMLNNLFITSAIKREAYLEDAQEVFETYSILKSELQKRIDLKRFSELWEIEFHEKIYVERPQQDHVPRFILTIAGLLPRLLDELYDAQTHGSIYETFAKLCKELQNIKTAVNTGAGLLVVTDDIINLERTMKSTYKMPTDRLIPQQKQLLTGYLGKFKVELEMEYRLK